MPAVVIVHQLCDEADAAQFSGSPGATASKSCREKRSESATPSSAVPDSGEGHLRGEGYPIALVWSCLLWEDLEPRFGDTEVPLPGSFCFRLEGGMRGEPVAFILSFS